MKKGRRIIALQEILPALFDHADVGKRLNPSPLQGGAIQLRGFKSRRRLYLKAPVEAATSSRAVITTAEAVATRNHIIGILAVDLKEIRNDLPQLPARMPQIREAR
jgi:hypothetical protein